MPDKLQNIAKSPIFSPDRRSQAFWSQYENKHLLGSVVTLIQQIQEFKLNQLIAHLAPSGFLQVDRPVRTHGDVEIVLGSLVVGTTFNDANLLRVYAPGEALIALAHGWPITLHNIRVNGATGSFGEDYLAIQLNDGPATQNRFDLVFLEVWREEIDGSDTIYPWGNVQSASTAIPNDLIDSRESQGQINRALEIRSRIRIIDGVDFPNHPFGLSDTAAVKAQGGAVSASSYTFANMGATHGDYGLWRAGDGDDDSRSALSCTDGYSYAIPIALIHRRNQSAFALTNPNGSVNKISDGTSDRPDGLYYDQVADRDVLDLRLATSLNHRDPAALIRAYRQAILGNTCRLVLAQNGQAGHANVWGTEIMRVEGLSTGDDTGVDETMEPDACRRLYSDESADQATVGFITNGSDDTDLNQVVSYTFSTQTITLEATHTDASAVIKNATPVMKWTLDGETVALSGSWSGLGGTTATATLDTGDSHYKASGQFYIEFQITYPSGAGITKVPITVHKITFNGTDMYVGDEISDLNLTNLSSTGSYGIAIENRTRAIVEIARREQLTANGNGIAIASGKVLAASAGTPSGGIVTGLSPSQIIDGVYALTPVTSDKIFLYYAYVPPQTPSLPSTLDLSLLHLDDRLFASNLGTGGGNDGQPWYNPLVHIPENASISKDSDLTNTSDLLISDFGGNWGLLELPVLFQTPWELVTQLSSNSTDGEGRPFYSDSDQDFIARAQSLTSGQWHRTALFSLARVKSGSGLLATGTLVLVCFSETTNEADNRAGVQGSSTFAVAIYPIKDI